MRAKLIMGAVLLGAASQANAADVAPRPVYKAPVAAPLYSWTGWYMGLNAGYAFGDGNTASVVGQDANGAAAIAAGFRPASAGLDPDGFIGGVQIGYNWQFGSFVYGLEADIQYTGIKDQVNVRTPNAVQSLRDNLFDQQLEYFGTVRGRLGAAWDRTLFYATGGFAYGGVNHSGNFFSTTGLEFTGNVKRTEVGYTVGAGVEHAFGPNWTARIEYLFYDLGDTTVPVSLVPGIASTTNGFNVTFENTGHILRGGVNLKF